MGPGDKPRDDIRGGHARFADAGSRERIPQQALDGTLEADVPPRPLAARGTLARDAPRTEAQGVDARVRAGISPAACRRHEARWVFRHIARKYRGLRAAVVALAAQALAGEGYANDAGQPLPALAGLGLARRPEPGQRHRLHL